MFLDHDVVKNINSSVWDNIKNKIGYIQQSKEDKIATLYEQKLSIKITGINQIVRTLSGGNRQKVSISKCLAPNPQIIILDEPTVGIDIKAKSEVYEIIWELVNEGYSVILITSDIDELIKIVDRVVVFRNGAIVEKFNNTKDYNEMSNKIMQSIFMAEKDIS